jgi:hypothetical protein
MTQGAPPFLTVTRRPGSTILSVASLVHVHEVEARQSSSGAESRPPPHCRPGSFRGIVLSARQRSVLG